MPRAASISLHEGWEVCERPAGSVSHPGELAAGDAAWHPARVPGTVAASLPGAAAKSLDDFDYWYRVRFDGDGSMPGPGHRLRFEGLATVAEAWLNGRSIHVGANMHRACEVDIGGLLGEHNELVIVFRGASAWLAAKRPRPRWKTALVGQQNLRWLRTSLLGRMPAWSPRPAPVGPWRAVTLIRQAEADIGAFVLQPVVAAGLARLRVVMRLHGGAGARVRVRIAGQEADLAQAHGDEAWRGELALPGIACWTPHTHGAPALHACEILVDHAGGRIVHDAGRIGFREVAFDAEGAGFSINGEAVFARGACWTVLDPAALDAGETALRATLTSWRDAGANMLRVLGTMVYEADAFYALCDELGIMVWQDFMFANMDYPFGDPAFRAEVDAEVAAQLARLSRHACIVMYCGGSEVAQQAAMLGLAGADAATPYFDHDLPAQCAAAHPGVPYVPSSPSGGALPFHVSTGISHYYGVGAYRRPLSDARLAAPRFTTECLGFSNIPENACLDEMSPGGTLVPHHPAWKAGVPRDNGAGWDFEDIRDHYLATLFGVDPVALRARDLARYLALSRRVPGILMAHCFAEWRRAASTCRGALVWFARDLVPGAGWGITDAAGRPKAAWWMLRRAWAPEALFLIDEGLNGHDLHVVNERDRALEGTIEVSLIDTARNVRRVVARADVVVPARGASRLQLDHLAGRFTDSTGAYRFGPAGHDVVAASLLPRGGGTAISEDVAFPEGHALPIQHDAGLEATATWAPGGTVDLVVRAGRFLQSVHIDAQGFIPDDNYFHLLPQATRHIRLVPRGNGNRFRAEIGALNLAESLTVRADDPPRPA